MKRWFTSVVAVIILATSAGTAVAAPAPFEREAMVVRSCVAYPEAAIGEPRAAPVLDAALAEALSDPRLRGVGVGLSLWVEGFGEVGAVNPDFRFRPASNQKILTAMAALEYIGPATTFDTQLVSDSPDNGESLAGDLVLVGTGDPTLQSFGDHSLQSLAQQVAATGVKTIDGDLVVDESRFDRRRIANTWSGFWIPTWVGSLSAVVVDENRWSAIAGDIDEPALANGAVLVRALAEAGVALTGGVRLGRAAAGSRTVATTRSQSTAVIVGEMVRDSNNMYAETLLKEIGYRHSGVGSSQAGLRAVEELVRSMCFPASLLQQDGSGLSDGNTRTARQWRRILQSAQRFDWWPELFDSLAVAGADGTLERRFVGTAAQDNLRAKTGSITGLRALTGVLVTAGGRTVFFSAIVDADEPRPPMAAIDALMVRVAEDES